MCVCVCVCVCVVCVRACVRLCVCVCECECGGKVVECFSLCFFAVVRRKMNCLKNEWVYNAFSIKS